MAAIDFKTLSEAGGVFKFGRGVLGKSAILIGIFLAAIVVAVWRLTSDAAIMGIVAFAAVVFFVWFFSVLSLSKKHPDVALLEGAEWTGWKRFEASAKGLLPKAEEREPTAPPDLLDTSTDQ